MLQCHGDLVLSQAHGAHGAAERQVPDTLALVVVPDHDLQACVRKKCRRLRRLFAAGDADSLGEALGVDELARHLLPWLAGTWATGRRPPARRCCI